jgi:DNA-binding response OmpR family regulator
MADKRRILLADDDALLRGLYQEVLSEAGYDIVPAVDGREAVQHALAEKFDLIITDVMMPYVDGYHVAYEVRTKLGAKAPPIMIMTSRDTNREMGIIKMCGAHTVIQKPFENAELCRRVAAILAPVP